MKQQSVQRIDYVKIRSAKVRLGSVMKQTSKALKQLTAQGIASATPEDVAAALTETAVPAIEATLAVINDVVEALPGGGEEEGLGEENPLGGEEEKGPLEGMHEMGEHEEKPLGASFENKNTQPGFQGAMDDGHDEEDDRIKDLEAKVASMTHENNSMKKAKLAERLAMTYPPNMRRTAMDDFLEEHEEEEDLDVMEAKVAMAEKVIKGYHDANMINKSRSNQYTEAISHTAKTGSKLRTAKDGKIDWRLRR